jgi:RimJ/RimL family protein N-acetyltransferase
MKYLQDMGLKEFVKLRLISENDAEFLYDMLKERDTTINVTHERLPTFNEHKNFLNSQPYDAWYIIELESKMVGNIWIDNQNRIGFFVKNQYKGFGLIVPAFHELKRIHRRSNYFGKVNPKNFESQKLLKHLNFVLKDSFDDYLLFEYRSEKIL